MIKVLTVLVFGRGLIGWHMCHSEFSCLEFCASYSVLFMQSGSWTPQPMMSIVPRGIQSWGKSNIFDPGKEDNFGRMKVATHTPQVLLYILCSHRWWWGHKRTYPQLLIYLCPISLPELQVTKVYIHVHIFMSSLASPSLSPILQFFIKFVQDWVT